MGIAQKKGRRIWKVFRLPGSGRCLPGTGVHTAGGRIKENGGRVLKKDIKYLISNIYTDTSARKALENGAGESAGALAHLPENLPEGAEFSLR